jgi:hypothetical protein
MLGSARKRRPMTRSLIWACVVSFVPACGNDHSETNEPVADAGEDAAPPAAVDAGDPNGTMDRAVELRLGDFPGPFDSLDGPGDADFFRFQGTAGEWVVIRSIDKSGFSIGDTPLTLFGAGGQPLAYNRYVSALRGEDVLARIVTRLPATGRYWVGVHDPRAATLASGLAQSYHVSVVDADGLEGYSVNTESDAPTEAVAAVRSIGSGTIEDVFLAGSFDAADDSDAFVVTISDGGRKLVDVKVDPSGVEGNGSTTPPGPAWFTRETDDTVIGKIDVTDGQTSLTPPLGAGRYLFHTAHGAGALGANDFYVVRALIAPDNPMETEDATNGAVASAEPLMVESGSGQYQAYILANVGDDDVDYFRFDSEAGKSVAVDCVSRDDGSGVVSLNVSLRDDQDDTMAEATEQVGSPVTLSDVRVPGSGSVYLRLSKESQLPDVTGDWARCVISAQ